MPSLSFFADERDAIPLLNWLNNDPEIAFIVPDGPPDPREAYVSRVRAMLGATTEAASLYPSFVLTDMPLQQRWKAARSVARLRDGKHCLWHVPSGPLPLPTEREADRAAPDAWSGWIESRPRYDPTMPNLIPGHPAEIYLELWTRHRPYSESERASLPMLLSYWNGEHDVLVLSTLAWIGDHYGPAPPTAWSWWRRLEAWVTLHAARIGGFPNQDVAYGAEADASFWAFPSALEKLKSGMTYEARGWDLDTISWEEQNASR
jgi:hypothetical protein